MSSLLVGNHPTADTSDQVPFYPVSGALLRPPTLLMLIPKALLATLSEAFPITVAVVTVLLPSILHACLV